MLETNPPPPPPTKKNPKNKNNNNKTKPEADNEFDINWTSPTRQMLMETLLKLCIQKLRVLHIRWKWLTRVTKTVGKPTVHQGYMERDMLNLQPL